MFQENYANLRIPGGLIKHQTIKIFKTSKTCCCFKIQLLPSPFHLQDYLWDIFKFFNFQALKYQTEQGPVDAVTGNAKYTINESNLLRETIDTKQLVSLFFLEKQ